MGATLVVEGTDTLATLGTAVTYLLGQFKDMAATLLSTPLFLIGCAIFVTGACIGLVKRLIHG